MQSRGVAVWSEEHPATHMLNFSWGVLLHRDNTPVSSEHIIYDIWYMLYDI